MTVKPSVCPRCEMNAVVTTISPDRRLKIAPESNVLNKGDKRRDECGFCHWWSEAIWTGGVWRWGVVPRMGVKQRVALDLRIRRVKKKRRAFGGKGR